MKPYIGLPLMAFSKDQFGWAGRSNFVGEQQLTSFANAQQWINKWADPDWYVIDGINIVCSSVEIWQELKPKLIHKIGLDPETDEYNLFIQWRKVDKITFQRTTEIE